MPIWFEVLAMSLLAYAGGFSLGWAVWGRSGTNTE